MSSFAAPANTSFSMMVLVSHERAARDEDCLKGLRDGRVTIDDYLARVMHFTPEDIPSVRDAFSHALLGVSSPLSCPVVR